ncbi:MAG TPA: CDP-alcohol phosphatidyltransferase family protein [Thermoanaerobaculia bacterium]|jgi:phosphatidylglycerophosphate synthase|nr:CDP-alcohol phosphatidyltransferase family protein [Thermoanaerobaculia bacterium]
MNIWRDRLHRWFAPIARRCPLSPNTISVLALLINVVAAYLFYRREFLIAIVFLIVGGWADAFDGIVARVQEKTSAYGDFLDHFADRVSDVLLVTGWLLGNGVRSELAIAVIIGVLLNGYIGTQIEATWHQREYDTVGRAEFVLALVVYPIVSFILMNGGWDRMTLAVFTIAEWMSVLLLFFALLGIAQRFALAARLR